MLAISKEQKMKMLYKFLFSTPNHIPLLTEKIDEVEFNYEIDGQFINIDLPDPSYKQLMEVVDDLNIKKLWVCKIYKSKI